jgi:hypothetical protein
MRTLAGFNRNAPVSYGYNASGFSGLTEAEANAVFATVDREAADDILAGIGRANQFSQGIQCAQAAEGLQGEGSLLVNVGADATKAYTVDLFGKITADATRPFTGYTPAAAGSAKRLMADQWVFWNSSIVDATVEAIIFTGLGTPTVTTWTNGATSALRAYADVCYADSRYWRVPESLELEVSSGITGASFAVVAGSSGAGSVKGAIEVLTDANGTKKILTFRNTGTTPRFQLWDSTGLVASFASGAWGAPISSAADNAILAAAHNNGWVWALVYMSASSIGIVRNTTQFSYTAWTEISLLTGLSSVLNTIRSHAFRMAATDDFLWIGRSVSSLGLISFNGGYDWMFNSAAFNTPGGMLVGGRMITNRSYSSVVT